ncbi:PRC-barrel domain-containing protein [Azospirillum sp. ST 5-10]|uniref:PRC-barrel domain-containing protein n=1 Tax=unclassified Azospirillum TaxID=2630922 RepID=UPI003F4A7A62
MRNFLLMSTIIWTGVALSATADAQQTVQQPGQPTAQQSPMNQPSGTAGQPAPGAGTVDPRRQGDADRTDMNAAGRAADEADRAEIQVRQSEPRIEVEQKSPSVHVDQPRPEVTVEQPRPEVTVQQPEPQVEVERSGQAQVEVQQTGEPDVQVRQPGRADVDGEEHDGRSRAETVRTGTGAEADRSDSATARTDDDANPGDLIGRDVVTSAGRDMGDVENLIVDGEGRIQAAVIEWGGFLGIGEKARIVPWEQARLDDANDRLIVDLSEDEIKALPEYDGDESLAEVGPNTRLVD